MVILKNRMIMAPMTRSRVTDPERVPGDLQVTYYRQRAGSGLIISEGTVVSPDGVGYLRIPGIYSDKQVEGWKKVTESVYDKDGIIFCQLWHVGRITHPDLIGGQLPLAPSAINHNGRIITATGVFKESVTPKAMTKDDIKRVVDDFRKAAQNAVEAGFPGVEIHSSNGYLFHQFFCSHSNQREDEYGGSPENRTRFFFEVLEAVASVIPLKRVGVRLNPMMHGSLGIVVNEDTVPTFDYLVNRLNDFPLAYLHVTRPSKVEDFMLADTIGHYRNIFKGKFIANGGYDVESGNEEVESGRASAIAFGKLFISNPDLVHRVQNAYKINTDWDTSTFYTEGPKGYTDYF